MHIESSHGLMTCLTDPEEAASADWTRRRDQVDVVKVIDPSAAEAVISDRAGTPARASQPHSGDTR